MANPIIVRVWVTGTAKAKADLQRRRTDFARKVDRGLVKGAELLFRAAQAIVPVDQGHLRGSGFIRRSGTGLKTIMRVGYTAEYAAWVHEDPNFVHGEAFNRKYAKQIRNKELQPWNGKVFHKRGTKQQYKFLEKPARENRKQIVKVVMDEIRKSSK